MESSDGNRHVKVFLHCPNCRSNLGGTIRDTLLLRKADTIRRLVKQQKQEQDGIDNKNHQKFKEDAVVQLTKSQQRLFNVIHTPEVREAITQARELEAGYMGKQHMGSFMSLRSSAGASSNASMAQIRQEILESYEDEASIEEWGFEVDLGGVHDSFRTPKENKHRGGRHQPEETVKVDPTLFAGLNDFLTDDQKRQITWQMTSGDPDQLAAASLKLWHVLHDDDYDSEGDAYGHSQESSPSCRCSNRPRLCKKSSVFQLIAEAQAAHEKERNGLGGEEKKTAELVDRQHQAFFAAASSSPPNQRRSLVGSNLQQQIAFQKAFPLPVRMPKTIALHAVPRDHENNRAGKKWDYQNHMVQLVDHEWDGTVIDSYSKISIGFLMNIYQHRPPSHNQGVHRILGGLDGQVEFPGQKRVLVLEAGRQAGKQGAVRGDVVTHINGQPVLLNPSNSSDPQSPSSDSGKTDTTTTASSQVEGTLLLLLHKQKQQLERGCDKVDEIMVTLNADRSVAEALKRRALLLDKRQDPMYPSSNTVYRCLR